MPTTTFNLDTDVGKLRILIGDRVVDGAAHFTDEELTALFDLEGDLRLAAATALDSWASEFATSGAGLYAVKIGDYSETPVGGAGMAARAKALRENARMTPAFAIADMNRWDRFVDVINEEAIRA